jgi:netrin-G3 ligand
VEKEWKKIVRNTVRYLVHEYPVGGALLRIELVRTPRDDAQYECVAENGVGDAVAADAILKVFESKYQECLYSLCLLYRAFHNVIRD